MFCFMKKHILITFLFSLCISAYSQESYETLLIYRKDNTIDKMLVEDIDSLIFDNLPSPPPEELDSTKFDKVFSSKDYDVWAWRGQSSKNGQEGALLRVTFRDMYVWSSNDIYDNALFMVKGKITDKAKRVAVNEENFPGLRKGSNGKYPYIERVFAVPTDFIYGWGASYTESQWDKDRATRGTHCRINVVFNNGQIYHNYPACYEHHDFYGDKYAYYLGSGNPENILLDSLFTKFRESVVWDSPNRVNPTKDAELVSTGVYYHNPALPDNSCEFHPSLTPPENAKIGENTGYFPAFKTFTANGTTHSRARFWNINPDNENCNSLTYMGGYAVDEKFTMIATYNGNASVGCRMCVFATNNGREWYNVYEFASQSRIVIDGTERAATNVPGIPLAQNDGIVNGGYQVRRRKLVVPTEKSKEPENIFAYDNYLDVTSIQGTDNSITVTTSSPHKYTNGDVVHFVKTGNDNIYSWINNDSVDGNSGGNGKFFIVKNVTENSFTLTMYIYDANCGLPIRHIHALNRCKDGVSVSTGEQYPQGWIMYGAIQQADSWAYWHPWNPKHINWIRLNSTSSSLQRPLGVIVKQEYINGKPETIVICGTDNEFTPMGNVEMPEGRTETFSHNSTGVYKCRLADVDDAANAEIILAERENCYLLQQVGNALVFTGQFGALAISYDDGKTWIKGEIPRDIAGAVAQLSGMTYDRKFSIGNTLIQLKR